MSNPIKRTETPTQVIFTADMGSRNPDWYKVAVRRPEFDSLSERVREAEVSLASYGGNSLSVATLIHTMLGLAIAEAAALNATMGPDLEREERENRAAHAEATVRRG